MLYLLILMCMCNFIILECLLYDVDWWVDYGFGNLNCVLSCIILVSWLWGELDVVNLINREKCK